VFPVTNGSCSAIKNCKWRFTRADVHEDMTHPISIVLIPDVYIKCLQNAIILLEAPVQIRVLQQKKG